MRKTIISAAVAAAMLAAPSLAGAKTTSDPHQHDQSAPAANAAGVTDPMMQMMSGMMGPGMISGMGGTAMMGLGMDAGAGATSE